MRSPRLVNPSQTSDCETHSRISYAALSLHHRETKREREVKENELEFLGRENQQEPHHQIGMRFLTAIVCLMMGPGHLKTAKIESRQVDNEKDDD